LAGRRGRSQVGYAERLSSRASCSRPATPMLTPAPEASGDTSWRSSVAVARRCPTGQPEELGHRYDLSPPCSYWRWESRAQAIKFARAPSGHSEIQEIRRSPCLCSGGAGNRTQVRKASSLPSFTCVVAITQATGLVDSATTYPPLISVMLSGAPSHDLALVVDALGVLGLPSLWTALRFLRPRERARCRSHVLRPA
jgi:hypothetical protein